MKIEFLLFLSLWNHMKKKRKDWKSKSLSKNSKFKPPVYLDTDPNHSAIAEVLYTSMAFLQFVCLLYTNQTPQIF